MSKIQEFKQITEQMANTYQAKNHDYGDSFGQSIQEFGLVAAAVRMNDKMNRFKSLIQKDALVSDESLRDTLLDLANYAIMTAMELSTPQEDTTDATH